MLFIYTLQHLTVDGICGAALAAYAVNEPYIEPIIYHFGLYNLIAFGSQWIAGYLLDKKINLIKYAFIISLVTLGLGTISELGIDTQVILLGIGNCLFHVSAGSLVLRKYNTYKELGIFVSSGAIGLALGLNMFCRAEIFLAVYAVTTAIVFYRYNKNKAAIEQQIYIDENTPSSTAAFAILGCAILLLSCVVLRGFGGSGASTTDYVMLFPCIFAIGKSLGGICCDKIGYKNTIVLIFVLSFLSLQFEGLIPILILTLTFNMTMPLTLRLVHWCNPNYPGMMFGLAAGCLLPGAFYYEDFSVAPQAMVVIQFLSLFIAGYLFKIYGRKQVSL
ncbi:MAG: hypothetical protein IJ563_10875 [Selenomonadaceae bacterium]|nr:hypothetical protein [Selenomonadaceae bacterium]